MFFSKSFIGGAKAALDTPCLTLDLDIMESNIAKARDFSRSFHKALRPHAKTHKCSRVAKLQIERGAIGCCVAKVSEAEALAAAGVSGILITSPVVTELKIARLLTVLKAAPDTLAVIDNLDNAQALSTAARENGLTLSCLLDLDPNFGRTGVSFADAAAFAERLAATPGLRLRGVQCYAGNLQHLPSFAEREAASLAIMRRAAGIFCHLRANFPEITILTGAGTGSYNIDVQVPEVTELQLGSYAVMDAEYLAIGGKQSAKFEDFRPSLTILSSVISVNQREFVTIDAGLKAIYRDAAVAVPISPSGATYAWFGDEQGKLTLGPGTPRPKLGDKVELIVSHCDPTINLHDRFFITRGDQVIDQWPIDLRGCCQ